MPARRCSPEPRRIGETARCISSTRPARRYCRIVATPPPSLTSRPLAASVARVSAAWMPSVTKWKVVPPSMAIDVRGVIGRVVAPPPLPGVVGPGSSDRPEHVAAHDPRSDVVEPARRKLVIDARRAALVSEHLSKRTGGECPFVQRDAAGAERIVEVLVRASAVAVEGYGEAV